VVIRGKDILETAAILFGADSQAEKFKSKTAFCSFNSI
jgi:hypothetical protein